MTEPAFPPRPRRRRRPLSVVSLLLAVLALTLGTGPSSAAGADWWTPTARPAPDSQINVTGEPFKGTNSQGEVQRVRRRAQPPVVQRGLRRPAHLREGVLRPAASPTRSRTVPSTTPTARSRIFDYITHGGDGKHDPVGWPTFKDWPAYDSLTHQANYYAWVERAWRGGQRVLVNDLVTNGMICSVYFFKDRGCDEMTPIRLQAPEDVRAPGLHRQAVRRRRQGLVPDRHRQPRRPARSIKQGKLAVVLGVETSEPFGCKQILDIGAVQQGRHRQGPRRAVRPGRAQHVPVPQVRQRAVRGPLRRGRPRYGDQRRPVPVDGHLLADGEVRGRDARQPHRRRHGDQRDPRSCRRASSCRRTPRTRSATTRAHRRSASTRCAA